MVDKEKSQPEIPSGARKFICAKCQKSKFFVHFTEKRVMLICADCGTIMPAFEIHKKVNNE